MADKKISELTERTAPAMTDPVPVEVSSVTYRVPVGALYKDAPAQTLTDGASIAWDVDSGVFATVTLGGNRTLANPTNLGSSGTLILKVVQDGTGSRTLAFGANYLWPRGSAPTLSAGADAVDILVFVTDGTYLYGEQLGGSVNNDYWNTVPGTVVRVSDTQFTITDAGGANNYLWNLTAGTVVKWTDTGVTYLASVKNSWLDVNTCYVTISGDALSATATLSTMEYAQKVPGRETYVRTWTSRTSAVDISWYSVCWSPELSLFVAVASTGTGNRVMSSPDGITWTARTSAADNSWYSVCWSPELSLFVAVAISGTGNRVMSSPDGITWTARTSAVDISWYSVCWSPELSLFVAVASTGTGNRVMSSPDGITWTARTSAADNSWYSVCWSPELSLFVAVAISGTGNRVMSSPDGITWTARTSATDNSWRSVCWSPELSLFVAVANTGTGNRVMSSPDGITWTARTSAADNNWLSVCWSPELSLFVAVADTGTGNRVMSSN